MRKSALIIGGTKGLGNALAQEAANNRNCVAHISGRSAHEGTINVPFNTTVEELDLTSPQSIARFCNYQRTPFDYIFWVAGILKRKSILDYAQTEFDLMISTHLAGPLRLLRFLHMLQAGYKHPYHLITIASTSSWRIRDNESVYCALKAAKAAFTRNFSQEIVRDVPGSKILLVNPGGIKTELFRETGQDTSKFMDPQVIAELIWNRVMEQEAPFQEIQIMRNDDGSPRFSYGPCMPELPTFEL